RRFRVRVEVGIDVPPVRRHLSDQIHTVVEEPPERRGIVAAAREAHAHPDHRDWLVPTPLQLGYPGLELVDLGVRPSKRALDVHTLWTGHRFPRFNVISLRSAQL